MKTIGAYQAKTHLSRLLQRVAQGELFTITLHGTPVAILQPPEGARSGTPAHTIADLRAFRAGRRLAGLSLRKLIGEGRR